MSDDPAYRPRRSVLYMPSSNERALEKAKTLPVDGLILDLEDAVGPDHKEAARENACAAAASGEYGPREVTIRVNGLGTALARRRPGGGVRGGARRHRRAQGRLGRRGARRSWPRWSVTARPERTRLWAMVETPRAVLAVGEIASASPRLAVLVIGTNDLVKELGARHVPGRAPLLTALSLALLAARRSGSRSSTASGTTSRTSRGSRPSAARDATWGSTARP